MSTNISTLNVRLTASTAAFTSAMAGAAGPLGRLSSGILGVGTRVAGLATALGGGALLAGVGGLGMFAIKLAADAEQAKVSFTTMLGSADAATALMAEINSFAASTPFQTTELIDASKKLLAFGTAQEQIIPTMRTLGDISAGLGIPLGELSELYGKAKVSGRLFAQDVNQLTGRGIPVIAEFAKQFGVAESEVKGLVESGQVNFSHLQTAMVSLTGEGGKFSGLMAAQSQTLSGMFSTLQDTATLSLTKVGESIVQNLDLKGAVGDIGTSLGALATVGLPILESFAQSMAASGGAGMNAGQLVLSGAELIATGLAYAMNAVDLIGAGWRAAQSGVAFGIGGMLKAIDWLGDGIVKLLNLLPGVSLTWDGAIGQMGDALLDEGSKLAAKAGENLDSFSDGSRVKSVGRFFDEVRNNAAAAASATEGIGDAAEQTTLKIETATATQAKKVTDLLDKMKTQVAEFNMSDAEKLAADVKGAGGSDADVAEATGLQGQLDALEKAKKLQEAGASVFDATRTPLENYETKVGELSDMLNAGAINWDTYGRAIREARGQLEGKDGVASTEAPDLMQAGSAQAARFAYDISRGSQKMTKDDLPKQQLAEAETATRVLERIARAAESRGETVDEVMGI